MRKRGGKDEEEGEEEEEEEEEEEDEDEDQDGKATTKRKKQNLKADFFRAKYIEGLENRLGRMETLLRMSGLLNEADGTTDLGTLEKKLADKAASEGRDVRPNLSERRSSSHTQGPTSNCQSPTADSSHDQPNGKTSTTEAEEEKPGEDVEHLSDMMCSLVTNNCGDSRYIGKKIPLTTEAHIGRILLRLLHLLSERHPMGQRKDRRHLFSADDLRCRRQRQMGLLEARCLWRHFCPAEVRASTSSAGNSLSSEGLL